MEFWQIKSRGAGFNPPNRFEKLHIDYFDEDLDDGLMNNEALRRSPAAFYFDSTKEILAKNDSPDVGFTFSINPYRGCEHGCIYCYARPSHEFLGFSSGIDFETRIMVKLDAPKLLEQTFLKKSWQPQSIELSGNTDCYQPVERRLELTRRCLEVFLRYKNPVSVITKNALITRDMDILKELSELNLVTAAISITTLNRDLSRKLEPRTSVPSQRFETVKALAEAGIPVGVMVAPIIPGLNDREIPSIIKQASDSGASFAGKIILKLPYSVKDLFLDWLERNYPEKASKIINRVKDVRRGKLNDPEFFSRMSGKGEIAESISQLFRASCKKYGLNKTKTYIAEKLFTRPAAGTQNTLFGS